MTPPERVRLSDEDLQRILLQGNHYEVPLAQEALARGAERDSAVAYAVAAREVLSRAPSRNQLENEIGPQQFVETLYGWWWQEVQRFLSSPIPPAVAQLQQRLVALGWVAEAARKVKTGAIPGGALAEMYEAIAALDHPKRGEGAE